MHQPRVILARPNSFIVKNMRQLIEEAAFVPTPISALEQMNDYQLSEIRAFVVSTGVSSVVKESFSEVIQYILEKYPEKPILLASLIDTEMVKTTVARRFRHGELDRQLLSVQEAAKSNAVKAHSHMLILEKKDIVDQQLYPTTLRTITSFFRT